MSLVIKLFVHFIIFLISLAAVPYRLCHRSQLGIEFLLASHVGFIDLVKNHRIQKDGRRQDHLQHLR